MADIGAARSVLETLHEFRQNEPDLQRIASVIQHFSQDNEPSVRSELAEQLPYIASFCLHQINLPEAITLSVLPALEHFLKDNNGQVRKITQNSLAYMLEQNYIDLNFVEEKVSPILVHLMDVTNLDDYRIEAVTTVSKIIRFLGKDVTAKVFLEQFANLCTDVSFHIRRVCAANFGEFCTVVGQELTESVLISQFKLLCEDGIWGVRKACADVFVPVSCVCTNKTRRRVLGPLFVNMLCDQSKWVKTAAFQALGPFISTFADPKKTGLYYNDGGVVVVDEVGSCKDDEEDDSSEKREDDKEDPEKYKVQFEQETEQALPRYVNGLTLNDFTRVSLSAMPMFTGQTSSPVPHTTIIATTASIPEPSRKVGSEFNTFQYWRLPLPNVVLDSNGYLTAPLDVECNENRTDSNEMLVEPSFKGVADSNDDLEMQEVDDGEALHKSEPPNHLDKLEESVSKVTGPLREMTDPLHSFLNESAKSLEDDNSKLNGTQKLNNGNSFSSPFGNGVVDKPITFDASVPFFSSTNNFICPPYNADSALTGQSTNISFNFTNGIAQYRKVPFKQDIIPSDLLEHYISMPNPMNYQIMDQDLTHHCAYSLPAVALTLGRKYWPCLKEMYELLALDMQWKVRWTLASSLHQMALILGPEYTSRDLLPIFLSFMKDLDEVRFGILQNLAATLRLLNHSEQMGLLPKISDFLKTDNNRNWRFRYTLTEQIIEVAPLYDSAQIKVHLLPIALTLMKDKVAEVRLGAIRLLSTLLKIFFSNNQVSDTAQHDLMLKETTAELVAEVSAYVTSSKWIFRQVYVLLCEQLLVDQSLPNELFVEHFWDKLLMLSADNVPNVRLALSRCLVRNSSCDVLQSHEAQVASSLTTLKSDSDQDVRRFAGAVIELKEPTSTIFDDSIRSSAQFEDLVQSREISVEDKPNSNSE